MPYCLTNPLDSVLNDIEEILITPPKPYIFMIRVTRQIKYIIAQAQGVIPHPLPEVNFLMVEIPTHKPYIFMIRVNRQIKFPKS